MANVYPRAKFNAHICTGNRTMAENQIKDGGHRHLEFHPKWNVGSDDRRMADIHMRTNFDTDIFFGDRDMAEN